MTARRVIVWSASTLFGFVSTIGTLALFNTTLDKFGIGNAILILLGAASLAFIWLDFILRTEYLRS